MLLDVVTVLVASVAGAVAAVSGFGVGSLLTPVLAFQIDTRLAVAAVSIPHVVGTALRLLLLRGGIDRRVLWSFGVTSAAGGLAGAALQDWAGDRRLAALFGGLLLLAAIGELAGLGRRVRLRGWGAWVAGALSGLLGGLVGNQGGIRSAALLAFDLRKGAFVGTATAIALFVDGARVPVYLAQQGGELASLARWIGWATAGVVAGTLVGTRALRWVPEVWFRPIVATVLAMLGVAMLIRATA
jgi:uncharacterized membrane protein YfcA